jgi:hypothetical protein
MIGSVPRFVQSLSISLPVFRRVYEIKPSWMSIRRRVWK